MSSHPVRLVTLDPIDDLARADALVESYRGLADVFHEVLAEQSLDALLERIADTLRELVPYEDLVVYEADNPTRQLIPVLARSEWAEEITTSSTSFGVGITGTPSVSRSVSRSASLCRNSPVGAA